MDPIYNLGIATYRNAVRIAAVRKRKAKLMLRGQRRCFRTLQRKLDPAGGYIWIHASSLGEFEQGRPLIEKIKREQPDARILLSFFSPSGYEVRKNFSKVDTVVYLPFDMPNNVKKFLDLVKPSMAIFVKYEFWGNYLQALKHRGVPTYIISAIFRPGQIFFRPWGGMFRKMLKCFDTLFVQNEQSRQLLEGIGIKNVVVAGDTRFDRVADVKAAAREFPLIAKFVEDTRFTLVMGSSWPPDEDIVIPYFNAHREMKLTIWMNREGHVLCPHNLNRALDRIIRDYNDEEKVRARQERRKPVLLPHFSAHHLRHTFCTRFCEEETDLKLIQEIMGHADITTTMDVYNESNMDRKRERFAHLEKIANVF